ncbi:MAG: hypothetical protein K2M31_00600 [Muribaculaceae bacterium]|nr:hypothetical protein [Muribaculaceae bacterium]
MSDRHQFRAKWHDYGEGTYFITICAHEKRHTFGRIVGTRFFASELGKLIEENIRNIPLYYEDVNLLNHVVMPNHLHIVLSIGDQDSVEEHGNIGCLKPPMHEEECGDYHHNSRLATIIGAFKAGVTREARTRRIASLPCWQSRYHEHIIRNRPAYDKIMNYVDCNVENWGSDCFA